MIGLEDGETNASNCKADGVRMTWDFEDCWTATGTEGPLEGKSFRCKVSTLTPEKWLAVAATRSYSGVSFELASPSQRKQAAYDYLEDHCLQCIESVTSTPETLFSTPKKTRATPDDAN